MREVMVRPAIDLQKKTKTSKQDLKDKLWAILPKTKYS